MTDTSGEKFRIELRGRTYTSRADAAHALASWAHDSDLKWAPRYASRDYGAIGQISGFDVAVATSPALGAEPMVHIRLDGVPRSGFTISRESFLAGGVGLIQRIENRAAGIPSLLEQARTDLDHAAAERAEAEQRIGQPFRHAQALADTEKDLARIESQLAAMQEDIDQAQQSEPAPDNEPPGLNVETVRAHRPSLGVLPDPHRVPTSSTATLPTASSPARDMRPRGL